VDFVLERAIPGRSDAESYIGFKALEQIANFPQSAANAIG
jgi:hypothetical protein